MALEGAIGPLVKNSVADRDKCRCEVLSPSLPVQKQTQPCGWSNCEDAEAQEAGSRSGRSDSFTGSQTYKSL